MTIICGTLHSINGCSTLSLHTDIPKLSSYLSVQTSPFILWHFIHVVFYYDFHKLHHTVMINTNGMQLERRLHAVCSQRCFVSTLKLFVCALVIYARKLLLGGENGMTSVHSAQ